MAREPEVVPTELYTTEGRESAERVKIEKQIPDKSKSDFERLVGRAKAQQNKDETSEPEGTEASQE